MKRMVWITPIFGVGLVWGDNALLREGTCKLGRRARQKAGGPDKDD
jgi:hypothetical protein